MSNKPTKSDEYRRLAAEATARADASGLGHVREKHEMAALQWATLAATEDSRNTRWATR